MNLTNKERTFAEGAIKRAQWPIFRHYEKLGWIALVLFAVGVFRGRITMLPALAGEIIFHTGITLFFVSILGLAITVIAKLYTGLQQAGLVNDIAEGGSSDAGSGAGRSFTLALGSWIDSWPWWAQAFLFPLFIVALFVVSLTAYYFHLRYFSIGFYGNFLISLLLWTVLVYALWKIIRWLSKN